MSNEIERVRDFTVLNRSNYFAIRKTELSENAEKLLFLLHIKIKMPYFQKYLYGDQHNYITFANFKQL